MSLVGCFMGCSGMHESFNSNSNSKSEQDGQEAARVFVCAWRLELWWCWWCAAVGKQGQSSYTLLLLATVL